MRFAVYTDYVYRRDAGRVYAERAFAVFLANVGAHLDGLVILGRVDPAPGRSRYALPDDVAFVELPYYASLVSPASAAAMVRSLRRCWRAVGAVDAVWLLGPHPLALVLAAMAAARRRRVALGVRQDTREYIRHRHPHRRLLHTATAALDAAWRLLARVYPIVVVGDELARRYPGRRQLPINVSLFSERDVAPPETARARSYDGELRVLSVGRLEEEKNPLLLADVLARLRAADPRWRLIVYGEGSLEDALRERLQALGVAAHAELRGYRRIDEGLLDVYRSSHAFLHVSLTEGVPQVLFEAFASRLPVVATAVGGVPAAVGDAALEIPPADAGAAVDALTRVAADAALRDRLIEAGVQRIAGRTVEAESRRVAGFLTA